MSGLPLSNISFKTSFSSVSVNARVVPSVGAVLLNGAGLAPPTPMLVFVAMNPRKPRACGAVPDAAAIAVVF